MTATKLVSEGCDWLTVTSQSEQSEELLTDLWGQIIADREITAKWIKSANWEGYTGDRIPHGFIGTRKDGLLLQLSGALAQDYAKEALQVGGRPSRMDIQVTGLPAGSPGVTIEKMFYSARDWKPTNGRPPELKMFVGRAGTEGLYVGRRASEVMLRIYDKGRESKEIAFKGCVRVEAEIKGDMARRYASMFCNEFDDSNFYRGVVQSLVEARGMKLPFDVGPHQVVLHKTRYTTPVEGKMAWLRGQVSGVVNDLIEDVGVANVASVLFPDQLDQAQRLNELLEIREVLNRPPRLS
jgi:hypothetical protein